MNSSFNKAIWSIFNIAVGVIILRYFVDYFKFLNLTWYQELSFIWLGLSFTQKILRSEDKE